jgi:hypothetical protein
MQGLPTELLYLLIFGAVLLFNFFTQQAARRRQAEAQQQQEEALEVAQDDPAPDEPIPDFWGRAPESLEALPAPAMPAEPIRRTTVPIASPARRSKRFSRESLLGSRRDMQNAIVVAMILGPCRALEPPGTSPGGAAVGTAPGRAVQ